MSVPRGKNSFMLAMATQMPTFDSESTPFFEQIVNIFMYMFLILLYFKFLITFAKFHVIYFNVVFFFKKFATNNY